MVSDTAYIVELSARAAEDAIEPARASVRNAVVAALGDEDAADTVAGIVAELAENAYMHGAWSADGGAMRIVVRGDEIGATVRVTNPIEGGARELIDTVTWIQSRADRAAFQ